MKQQDEIKVRKAEEKDLPSILALTRELGFNENQEDALTNTKMGHIFKLCKKGDNHTVLIAENRNGIILGYIVVHWLPYFIFLKPEGYIGELFVKTTERGKGIGKKLLKEVKKEAIKRSCFRLNLLNLKERLSYQQKFYEKAGFTERRELANFILKLPKH